MQIPSEEAPSGKTGGSEGGPLSPSLLKVQILQQNFVMSIVPPRRKKIPSRLTDYLDKVTLGRWPSTSESSSLHSSI